MNETVLLWPEVEDAAESVFNWWLEDTWELRWARRAWAYMEQAGLVKYRNELERHRAVICFLSLAEFYTDFVSIAWKDCITLDLLDLADFFHLKPCYLAVLLSREPGWNSNLLDCSDPEICEDGLHTLSHSMRPQILQALLSGFGDKTLLLSSLWKTQPEHHGDPLDEAVNTSTEELPSVLSWIQEGCPPLPHMVNELNATFWE